MFRVITKTTVSQISNEINGIRAKHLVFNSLVEYSASNSWQDLTDTAKIILPKTPTHVIDGSPIFLDNITGIGSNIGGFSEKPTFLRGDKININAGYIYQSGGQTVSDTATIFEGFISKVKGGKPFELECEDNMWILKQTPAVGGSNGVFSYKKYTVESMIRELFNNANLPYTVNALTSTNIGIDFRVNNNTIGQVLERLRKDVYQKSYFRGSELRTGSAVYIETDALTYNFDFQKNIISNNLEYNRKDDIVLSAIGKSTNIRLTGGTTKDGFEKTKSEAIEVLVTFQNGRITSIVKQPGKRDDFPINNSGERRDFTFNNITDPAILIERTKEELLRYYYDGYRGNFTTFGIPFVKFGDNVTLVDKVLPERNGSYKVKKVDYSFTVDGGMRQQIELDFRLTLNNH